MSRKAGTWKLQPLFSSGSFRHNLEILWDSPRISVGEQTASPSLPPSQPPLEFISNLFRCAGNFTQLPADLGLRRPSRLFLYVKTSPHNLLQIPFTVLFGCSDVADTPERMLIFCRQALIWFHALGMLRDSFPESSLEAPILFQISRISFPSPGWVTLCFLDIFFCTHFSRVIFA